MVKNYKQEMIKLLAVQKERYPLMTEEDIVKFAFQGMLGVGHLIRSEEAAAEYLRNEMAGLEPDDTEPLTEEISPDWLRLNLRPAKARGLAGAEIVRMLCESARKTPQTFTRQDVYRFCAELDGSDRMKKTAEKVLDEEWLPSHSRQYREAYHPAYRVLYAGAADEIKEKCQG